MPGGYCKRLFIKKQVKIRVGFNAGILFSKFIYQNLSFRSTERFLLNKLFEIFNDRKNMIKSRQTAILVYIIQKKIRKCSNI